MSGRVKGWLYLAVVIDLYARRVIGWEVSDRMHAQLALSALNKAVTMRECGSGLIHHSDRGSQYCANAYQTKLRENGIAISMSGKGNAYDNAMVESFFKTLKTELIWRTTFNTRQEATSAIARYIDGVTTHPDATRRSDTSASSNSKDWPDHDQSLFIKTGQVHGPLHQHQGSQCLAKRPDGPTLCFLKTRVYYGGIFRKRG